VRRIAAALIAVAAVAWAHAPARASVTVSMPSLNLYFGQTDLDDSGGTGSLMKIERGYNSTTTFSGLFGYGWGTWQDQTLEMRPDGRLQFAVFGGGSKTVLESSREQAAADPVPELLGAAQQAQMVGSDDEERRFRTMTGTSNGAFDQYEAFLKTGMLAPADVSLDSMFHGHAAGLTWSRVVRVPEGYQVTKIPDAACGGCDSFEGIFTLRGHLVRSWLPGKPHEFVTYTYNEQNDRLIAMQDEHNKRYTLTYDSDGHITRVDTSTSTYALYTYKRYPDGSADLASSRNVNGFVLRYAYDTDHDVTEIAYPDKTVLRATYVEGNGSVGTVTCPNGTKFAFERTKDAKPTITMTTTTPAGAKTTARFDPDHYQGQQLCT